VKGVLKPSFNGWMQVESELRRISAAICSLCLKGWMPETIILMCPVFILFFHIKYLLDNDMLSIGLDYGDSTKSKTYSTPVIIKPIVYG
jgi:hypothetical protein